MLSKDVASFNLCKVYSHNNNRQRIKVALILDYFDTQFVHFLLKSFKAANKTKVLIISLPPK